MKVLVIGASGLVGSHCLRYLKEKNIEVIGTYRNYQVANTFFFDPSFENCFDFLNEIALKPDIIIHCGALTNVDYCENNQVESYDLTVNSTEKIVNYCKKNKIKLVYLSTDYVFDGLSGPYLETENTNPINVYGKHKMEAEKIVQELGNYIIARITNVYGEENRSKNFIAHLISVVNSGVDKTFKLPFDQFATPVYAGDIAKMIYLLMLEEKNGIYNLSSTDYYSRYQLAKRVKSLYNNSSSLKLEPVSTKILNQRARRPLNGGLLNIKFSNEFPNFEYTNIDKFILKTINNGIEEH
jgi:dTDP-4-dehydrorhamnose reductase